MKVFVMDKKHSRMGNPIYKLFIPDVDGKVYHRQSYAYTDAKRDLRLYWDNGVLMLSGEY